MGSIVVMRVNGKWDHSRAMGKDYMCICQSRR